MFKELVPVLRDRAVLLTVTLVDADQIRVNIVPKKLKDGDHPTQRHRHCRGSRRRVVHDHRQFRRLPSSDEEYPGEGQGRDGCGFQGCPGRGPRKGEDVGQDSAAEYGSHSEYSDRQTCRTSEVRTPETSKPI